MTETLTDGLGRRIDYVRISVTDRCNLRCVYCMPKEGHSWLQEEELLTWEELLNFCQGAALAGICKFKVTGGEPLLRPGILEFLRKLKSLPGVEKVTLTTNGVLLEDMAEQLADLGLDGVNISLDAMDKEQYKKIAGRDMLEKVLHGIEKCCRAGIPTKINCVPMKEVDQTSWIQLARLAKEHPIDVRFIEMMPIGEGKHHAGVKTEEVRTQLEQEFGPFVACTEKKGNGPATYVTRLDFRGSIGFISAMSHGFCGACNRVRLTADGKLKLCLHHTIGVEVRELLRRGGKPEEICTLLKEAVLQKPKDGTTTEEQRQMWQIGG